MAATDERVVVRTDVATTFTLDLGWNADPYTYELFFGQKLPERFHTTPEQKERYMMKPLDAVPGDVVTLAKGEFGKPGYRHEILTVVNALPSEGEITPAVLEDRVSWRGYRITERVKRGPAIPSPRNALAFADDGLFISDGDRAQQWSSPGRDYRDEDELRNPIEAVAVPAEELRGLFRAIERHNKSAILETQGDVAFAARRLVEAAQSQHERAGVKFDA